MADEKKEEKQEVQKEEKLTFKNADELSAFLMDIQGQMSTMQETIDKLSPVEESAEVEGKEDTEEKEELSDDEVSEIDRLLQSE